MELEPGPLFVVRDWPTLREFCKDLASKRCSPCVGLNLDIAHWRLASRQAPKPEDEITPEKVAADPLVFRRVAHAHVAGHHPSGHFGDIPLEALNDPERDFGPWIRLLVSRAGLSDQESGELKFSGYLSIELEATKHSDLLTRSVETLARLLGHVSPKGVA